MKFTKQGFLMIHIEESILGL